MVEPHDAQVSAPHQMRYDEDVVLLPGLVDTHVHLQTLGTDWEGFGSGTPARSSRLEGLAAAGVLGYKPTTCAHPVRAEVDAVRAVVDAAAAPAAGCTSSTSRRPRPRNCCGRPGLPGCR